MAPVSVRRIDSHTVEASYMRGFKTAAVSRRVVSKNGLVLTIITTSSGESGIEHSKVGVYDKSKSRTDGARSLTLERAGSRIQVQARVTAF
jgi:hypothetical protein